MKILLLLIINTMIYTHIAPAQILVGESVPTQKGEASSPQEVLKEINQEREKRKLKPLRINPQLQDLAQEWAEHIARRGSMEHRSHRELQSFVMDHGLESISENLAYSSRSWKPGQIVRMWMESKRHRENLLQKDSEICGIGLSSAGGKYYATFNGARLEQAPTKGN